MVASIAVYDEVTLYDDLVRLTSYVNSCRDPAVDLTGILTLIFILVESLDPAQVSSSVAKALSDYKSRTLS